jgi:hypothetical protein
VRGPPGAQAARAALRRTERESIKPAKRVAEKGIDKLAQVEHDVEPLWRSDRRADGQTDGRAAGRPDGHPAG